MALNQAPANKLDDATILGIVSEYMSGTTADEVGRIYGCHRQTVYNYVNRAGLETRKRGHHTRLYSVDDHFFDVIDTEEKAYWLGFIAADGYVAPRLLSISIAVKDESHLLKLLDSMSSNYPIHRYYNGNSYGRNWISSLRISSHGIASALSAHGLEQRKTFTVQPHPCSLSSLAMHYWRGVFDGDGCICRPDDGSCSLSLTGNVFMVDGFRSFVMGVSPTTAKVTLHRNGINHFYLVHGMNFVRPALDVMYGNSTISLQRKFELYQRTQVVKTTYRKWFRVTADEWLSLYDKHGSWECVAQALHTDRSVIIGHRKRLGMMP
mgnify:CR=1 FL=1